jgi:hypothetical protein
MSEIGVTSSHTAVLDLGRRKKKAIRRLKDGEGQLAAEVSEAARSVAARHGSEGKEVLPVVLLYRKRARRKRGGLLREVLRSL